MKILVNASSVAYGGGLILTLNIINTFKHFPDISFLVIAPKIDNYKKVMSDNVQLISVHRVFLKRILRIYTDNILIKKIIKNYKPEIILSLGNLPLATKVYQVFIHDNPLAVVRNFRDIGYKGLKDIIINRLRNKLLALRLSYVDHIITQTGIQLKGLNEVFADQIQRIERKSIITPSIPEFQICYKTKFDNIHLFTDNKVNLLCLSRYYPHKNIEILLDVAMLFKKNNKPYRLILTISPEQDKRAGNIIKKIGSMGLSDYIDNIGEISLYLLDSIMKCADAVILPSLMESYSLVYIEAMFFHKYIFVSDLDFAHEACQNAAFYFNPRDATDIYNSVISAYNNRDELQKKINYQKSILNKIDSWDLVMNTILKYRIAN